MYKFRIVLILFLFFTATVHSVDIEKDIVTRGAQLIGTPYRYGGINPSGFDCSGLVNYLYKSHVPSLPRMASQMSGFGTTIPLDKITTGDLVFYATGQDRNEITHVGIYIGQNTLIQAVSAGPERGVILTDLDERYWKERYKWVKRVLPRHMEEKLVEIEMDFNKGRYTGTAINNEPEGAGQMILENGDVYNGQFHDGLFHGSGEYIYSNGDAYVGQFENGRESGGEIVKSNGSRHTALRNSQGELIVNNRRETTGRRSNYLIEPPRSWDDWFLLEMEQFENFKRTGNEAVQAERERFEEWKRNN